ncbi:hypothetical protein B7494_g8515 [Chlorociboria aeruginascens]|nr:hypothetical protein B7494_g8515 [Chlorociboria aeruginascens]
MAREKRNPAEGGGKKDFEMMSVKYDPLKQQKLRRKRAHRDFEEEKREWEAENPGRHFPQKSPMVAPLQHRRAKQDTRALQEIKHYQSHTGFLIPRMAFQRLVREIFVQVKGPTSSVERWQSMALASLQEVTEAYLAAFFEASNMCAIHAKRVTVNQKDMQLVRWFCDTNLTKETIVFDEYGN